VKLRESLVRAGPAAAPVSGWSEVKEPLRSDPRAKAAFEAWAACKASSPSPDAPGFLEHFDREREAYRRLVDLAALALGGSAQELSARLRGRLSAAKLEEGGALWKRAWSHHWGRLVCETWGIPE
jgi:cell division septation protein DedD